MKDKKRAAYGLQLKREKRTNNHRTWRQEHLNAQRHVCFYCRKSLSFEASVLHHIIKIAAGGEDIKSNTVACCMIRMLAALGALGVPMAPVSDPYLYMPDPPDPRTQEAYDKASAKRARKNAARLRMVANGTLLARDR